MKKFPGPVVTFSAMVVCPFVAAALGIVLLRRRQRPWFGLFSAVSGALLLLLFTAVIGRAMVTKWLASTSLNPSTPRPIEPQTGLPVFPGAEGFGTRTRAGRGGKVIEVTTLADAGPGSLRGDRGPRAAHHRVSRRRSHRARELSRDRSPLHHHRGPVRSGWRNLSQERRPRSRHERRADPTPAHPPRRRRAGETGRQRRHRPAGPPREGHRCAPRSDRSRLGELERGRSG